MPIGLFMALALLGFGIGLTVSRPDRCLTTSVHTYHPPQ